MTDHPSKVREARDALLQAVNDAQAAGYRVDGAGGIADLAASETARVGAAARPAPGDEYEAMTKSALLELAAARNIAVPASSTKADVISLLKNPPAPPAG